MRVHYIVMAFVLVFGAGASAVVQGAAAQGNQPNPDDAKKKADEAKKKAEDAKKKAEEQIKKQDDPKNWPARDLSAVKAIPSPICVYIKDPRPKKNHEAEMLEGKDFLGNDEVRAKLRAFNRLKIKNDGSDGKGWPPEWMQHAMNGAVLVLSSSDLTKIAIFDKSSPKGALTRDGLSKAADEILKYEADRKAVAEAKAKEEAAKAPPPPEKKAEVPGLDIKKPEKEKKKTGPKEPQDE
ncbi:MAG: hypothetical protein NTW87_15115 [Planctomycetota bacterium]|nr:hypothetical protein [Planctomycetota bacterium]